MDTVERQTMDIISRLNDSTKMFVLDFLKLIENKQIEDTVDNFYSEKNQKRLAKSIEQGKQGKLISVSMDELRAMADE